jgi:hypothetical protein
VPEPMGFGMGQSGSCIVAGMRRKIVVVLASALLIALVSWGQDPSAKARAAATKDLLEAAEEAWKDLIRGDEYATVRGVEPRYLWSRRLADASRAVDPSAAAAATRAHLERMEVLLERCVVMAEGGRISRLDFAMGRYYVAEAKVWMEEAR